MKKILFFTILILFVSTQIVSAEDNAPKLPTFSEITVGGVNIKSSLAYSRCIFYERIS